jgi:hypothetical protein
MVLVAVELALLEECQDPTRTSPAGAPAEILALFKEGDVGGR